MMFLLEYPGGLPDVFVFFAWKFQHKKKKHHNWPHITRSVSKVVKVTSRGSKGHLESPGGGNSNIFGIFTPKSWRFHSIHFDERASFFRWVGGGSTWLKHVETINSKCSKGPPFNTPFTMSNHYNWWQCFNHDFMAGQPTPPPLMYPPRNKGLIAGLNKGNHWLVSPDHKAGYF